MTTDLFRNDVAAQRHDERAELVEAGIRDVDLRDEIIQGLVDDVTVRYEPESGRYWVDTEGLDEVIDAVIAKTATRLAEDIEDQGRDLDIVGHAAGVVRDAHMSAAGVARALAALYGAEATR